MRIRNYESLINHGHTKGRRIIADIIEAGLSAANPYTNVSSLIRLEGSRLIFDNPKMIPEGAPYSGPQVYDLDEIDRVYVFGIGKGIQYLIKPIEELIGDRITDSLVLAKHGDDVILEQISVMLGGHPIPDEYCIEGMQRILDIIRNAKLTKNDLVITAMGNGIGSLCTLPVEGITVEEIRDYTYMCQIDYGISTDELNYIRNSIDRIRGGRYCREIHPARMVNLMGVGPNGRGRDLGYTGYEGLMYCNFWMHCLPDCTTPEAGIAIAKKWGVFDKLPLSIRNALLNPDTDNLVVTYDEYKNFDSVIFGVMPEGMSALNAAREKAKEYGFATHLLTQATLTEASVVGHFAAQVALTCDHVGEPFKAPCAIFATGELLTTVQGEAGVGGTNQEYCLAASLLIKNNKNIVMAAVDTDGTDGPGGYISEDAELKGINVLTGGIVDGQTAITAEEKGIDIFEAIKTHNSSRALWSLDSGIAAVQSISVGDLHCTLIFDD